MTELKLCQKAGIVLKKLRVKRNMTAKELAKSAKLSLSTIYKIETGKSDIKIFTLWKLCRALEIKELDFIKMIEQHPLS